VLLDDLLELLHPAGVLVSEIPLLGDFSLERDCPRPTPAKLLLGLLEQLLVSLQHPALLPVRFEQLGKVQTKPRLGGASLLQLGLQRAA
jgi:hypothetical protein